MPQNTRQSHMSTVRSPHDLRTEAAQVTRDIRAISMSGGEDCTMTLRSPCVLLFIEVFRLNHSNIKWLINRPCGTELVKYSLFVQANVTTLHAFRIVFTVIFCCFVFHFVTIILWEMVFTETYMSRHLL